MLYNFLILLLLLAFSGCSAIYLGFNDQTQLKQDVTKEKLYHIVLCWLKDPGNEMHRKQIIEITKTFQKIPGVIEAQAG